MEVKELRIDGEIGSFFNMAEDFKWRLEELQLQDEDELKVIINSQGGSVLEGFAIYNMLKSLPNKVTTKVEGFAASIATLIMLAGETVEMSQVSLIMIHNSSIHVDGNKEEVEKQIEVLASIDNTLKSVYAAKTGLDSETIDLWMKDTKYFDYSEAKDIGIVDVIVDKIDAKMVAQLKNNNKKKIMSLTKFFTNMVKDPTATKAAEVAAKAKAELEAKAKLEAEAGAKNALTEEEETELARLLEKQAADEEEETEEEETEEEAKARLEAEALAKAEAGKGVVTTAQLEGVVNAVSELAAKIDQNMQAQSDSLAGVVDAAIEAKVKGTRSRGTGPTAAGDLNVGGDKPWVDVHAGWRNKMKEIEKKTRQ